MRKKRKQLRPVRRRRFFLSVLFNKKRIGFALGVSAIIFLPILYLYQTNLIAQRGFEVRELEKQLTNLKQEQFELDQERVKFQSVPHLQKSLESMDMVKVKSVDYIDNSFMDVAYVKSNSL